MRNNRVPKEIRLFFREPWRKAGPREGSPLVLLRRSIMACFCLDPSKKISYERTREPDEHQRYFQKWTAVMLICAGIDLLGKLYAGDDCGKDIECRFRAFIGRFFKERVDRSTPKKLYGVRNALMHSFGLVDIGGKRRYVFRPRHRQKLIVLIDGKDKKGVEVIRVDWWGLWRAFEGAVAEYERALESDSTLRGNFDRMRKYARNRFD